MGQPALALSSQELEAYRRLRLASARTGILGFTKYTYPEYKISWHHRAIARALNGVVEGRITRLMINVQPRAGKSELVSRRLPPYYLGRFPDREVVACSYNDRFAGDMNMDVQGVMDTPGYAEVFPGTALAQPGDFKDGKWARNTSRFQVVGRRGKYRSAGVGGSLTGYGAHLAIIDDPVKNADDVRSPIKRDRVFDWYATTLLTRLYRGGAIILCMTRWHEDDLAGRLLRRAREDTDSEQWTVLSLPSVAEEAGVGEDPRQVGEALWPEEYPLPKLKELRHTQGEAHFVALYQQRPAPAEGAIIKRDWWRYWTALPEQIDVLVVSGDLNLDDDKERLNDFTVYQVWARSGADYYLLDQIRERMDYPRQKRALARLAMAYPDLNEIYIEYAANGPAIIKDLQRTLDGIVAVKPKGSKVTRLQAVSGLIEAGNVFVPDPNMAGYEWVRQAFVEELATFPNGKNDDQVDALSQALSQIRSRHRNWNFLAQTVDKEDKGALAYHL